jgi:hypothetical protein
MNALMQPGRTLRLGVLSDLHLAPARTPPTRFNTIVRLGESRDLVRSALSWLAPRVDALALLGDLTQSAAADEFGYLVDLLDDTGLPAYLVPGNHDIPAAGPAVVYSATPRRARASLIVTGPERVSHGPVLITSAALEAHGDGFRLSRPGLLQPAGRPLIFLTHFPALEMRRPIERHGWRFAGDLANRGEVQQALHAYGGPVIVLAGHLHVRGHAIAGNILQLAIAALAERPSDATIVRVTSGGGALDVTRHSHSLAPDGGPAGAVLDPSRTGFAWREERWQPDPSGHPPNGDPPLRSA